MLTVHTCFIADQTDSYAVSYIDYLAIKNDWGGTLPTPCFFEFSTE